MQKLTLLAILGISSLMCATAYGQQIDATFGFNALTSRSSSNPSSGYQPQSVGGGLTPSFSFDALITHHVGVNAEFSWRASKNLYQGTVPFRPFFYDFNAVWAPRVTRKFSPEVMAGIGVENTHFYVAPSCGTNCTNYVTTNHFMGHFGGGLRYYVLGNVFVRPEAHWYLIHNNNQFSSPYAARYGMSIGYTFGGR